MHKHNQNGIQCKYSNQKMKFETNYTTRMDFESQSTSSLYLEQP